MPSPDLILDENHQYWVDGRPQLGLNEILLQAGLIEEKWYTEDAKERGSEVHRVIAELLLERQVPVPRSIQGYFQAAMKFLNQSGFLADHVEESVHSPTYQFCTTPDAWGAVQDKPAIVEFKTGQPAKWHGLQLAGQALAINDSASRDKKAWLAFQRFGVYLADTGKYRVVHYQSSDDLGVFLAALTICRWKGAL
jgi:hypothetical protein